MVKRYRNISQMNREDRKLLASLLCLPPTARLPSDGLPTGQWLARQSEKVSRLPKALQRPQNWLARLSIYTNEKLSLTIEDLVPQCAVLCAAHKGLNPWVVHRVFLLISEEVTHRLDPVRKYLENPTKHDVRLKTSMGEVQDYVDRMNSILSLWTGPEVFSRIVGESYPAGLAMPRVENDCEACICSCIGASGQALCDLRAMMYGRSHRHGPPVLLPLVEAWMDRFGEENAARLWAESSKMARDVKHLRRRFSGHKGGHRRHRTPHEKRLKERARLERSLEDQRLSARQVRLAQGEIDKKLDELFGEESRDPGKHPSSSASAGAHRPSSNSKTSSGPIRPKNTRNDHPVLVDDNLSVNQQEPCPRPSWDGADDAEASGDYADEFNEADADAAYRQQDRLQGWYDNFTDIVGPSGSTDVGSQHPAFRQSNAAEMENIWAQSQMAMSALPKPLQFNKSVTPRRGDDEAGDDDDDDDDDLVPSAGSARTEVSEWTDISMHTVVTHNSRRDGRPQREAAPAAPRLPSTYGDEPSAAGQGRDYASTIVGMVQQAPSYGHSSVYSNDAPAAAHPPPAATTAASMASGRFERPRTPPRLPVHNRSTASDVTAWPGRTPNSSNNSRGSGHHRTASSNTTLSSQDFQAGLNSINQLDDSSGAGLPSDTLLPDDSISAVGRFYPHVSPDAAYQYHPRLDRRPRHSDGSGESGLDDDVRAAIKNSRVTARQDEERRAGRVRSGGQFSGLYMPDSSWL